MRIILLTSLFMIFLPLYSKEKNLTLSPQNLLTLAILKSLIPDSPTITRKFDSFLSEDPLAQIKLMLNLKRKRCEKKILKLDKKLSRINKKQNAFLVC